MNNVQPETSLPTALNTDDVPDAILARWEDADADQSSDDAEEASQLVEQEETIDEVDLTEIDETEEDTEDDETELEQDETDTEDTDEDSEEDDVLYRIQKMLENKDDLSTINSMLKF